MKTIAHRGAKGQVSENTLASFERALELGCDGIELDVHLSADGELIVFHDQTLERLTGASGNIEDLTLSEIRELLVDGIHPIPTLREALDLIDGRCLLNIELKTAQTTDPVMDLISESVKSGVPISSFLVSSFDWPSLQYLREQLPELPIGVLTHTDLDLAVAFAQTIQAETLHPYYHLLNQDTTRFIQSLGLKVYTWTVNEPEDLDKMKAFGVDGIITDYPERL